jgi:hypothetical protein
MMTDGVIPSRHNKNNDLIKIKNKKERVDVSSANVGSWVGLEVAVGLPQYIQLRGPQKEVCGSVRDVGSCRKWGKECPLTICRCQKQTNRLLSFWSE